MSPKSSITLFLWVALVLQACRPSRPVNVTKSAGDNPYHDEVIYHVVQRSFYDSNGDMQGGLNGLRQKLDYLQDLGVTSILLVPLYESVYYHNYFSGNFEKIDSEFGTMQDYLNLIKVIPNDNDHVFSFMKSVHNKVVMVVNLSGAEQQVNIDAGQLKAFKWQDLKQLWGGERLLQGNGMRVTLPGYAVDAWGIENDHINFIDRNRPKPLI